MQSPDAPTLHTKSSGPASDVHRSGHARQTILFADGRTLPAQDTRRNACGSCCQHTLLASGCADTWPAPDHAMVTSQSHILLHAAYSDRAPMACHNTYSLSQPLLHVAQAGKSPNPWSAAWQPPRIAGEPSKPLTGRLCCQVTPYTLPCRQRAQPWHATWWPPCTRMRTSSCRLTATACWSVGGTTKWWPCSTGEGQAADVWQHGRV